MKITSVSPFFKVLSAILSVIILFYSIPATVWAFDDLSLASYTAIEEAEKADLSHSPYYGTIIEVKECRTLSDKTLRLSDGSFYAAHYNTNVHEEDAYGNLQDIDNRLNSKNGFYVTENGHKSLPVYPGESMPVYSFSSGTHSFSIIPEGRINPSAKGEVSEMKTELGDSATDLDRLITLDRILSKVTYRDILPETDIEYVLYGSDVKENIILKSGSGSAVYSFILALEGLYAKLTDNGEIILNDTDGVFRYRIPSAVMWDADNAFSDKVETVFEDLGEGKYRITYIPDADWLSSADRQYPVVLDPSVYAHSSNVLDLYVSASSPSASFPADSSLHVSSTERTYWKMTSLIPLPSHCYITNATITLMSDENPKAKNNVKTSVVSTQHSSNYLLNGGFEQGSDIPYWTSSGNVGRGYSDNPINKSVLTLLLDRSVSLSSVYQYVDLKRNDYTLSADFLNVDIPEGVTVWLKAESVQNSAHSVTKTIPVNRSYESEGFYSESLRFSAEPSAAGGTERFKISITLSGHVSEATALSVDNVMLSCTRGAGEYDLVSAGHFEDTFGISPESFWELPYISGNAVTVDSGNSLFGKVLKMDYSPEEVSVVSQKIYQAPEYLRDNFDRGEYSEFTPVLLTYSGWAKGTGQSYSDDAFFCIDLEIRYYIGNGRYSTKTVSADFDRGITDWQFVSDAFMSDRNDRIIDSVTVLLYYTGHDGVGYFDDITVTVDSSNAVVNCYNNSGYLTSSRSGKGGIYCEYNSDNDIVKSVDTLGRTIVDYEYDSAGRIYKQTQSKYTGNDPSANIIGISRTRYTYNTAGLITEILVQDSENTSLQTQTSVEYYESDAEHIYGAIKKVTDVLGNETKYFRNPQNGRTEAVIGPNGKGTTYTYDGMGRTETVLPATYNGTAYTGVSGSSKVQYGYDSAGRLSTITTRETAELGTTYNFSYDVFGNGTGVSIGTRELASYTYNTRNGKLNTLAYGNGLNVRYVYDEYERISEIRYRNGDSGNFTTRYRYTYDSSGNLYSIEDIANHEITVNDYDSSGILRSTLTYSSTDYYNKYGSHYYYDDESRCNEIHESFDYSVGSGYSQGGNSYLFRYTNEGSLDKYSIIDYNYSAVIKPQYDNLGRTNTRTVTAGTTNTAHHFYNSLSFGYVSTEEYCTGRINQFRSTVKVSPRIRGSK